jgi:hypothetical protein
VLHIPSAIDKLTSQPIQQLCVERGFSLGAQVIEHFAEAAPEKLLPKSVYKNAGS